jgi:ketosteroid isomerase-like protein
MTNEQLIRQYIAAYNAKDVPGMMALLHEVIVFENVSTGTPDRTQGITATSGKAEFEALARQSLNVFNSRRQTIRSLTLGDRTAAVEIEYEATLAVDLPNGAKAGEILQLRGVSVFAFSDGKISRISDYQ